MYHQAQLQNPMDGSLWPPSALYHVNSRSLGLWNFILCSVFDVSGFFFVYRLRMIPSVWSPTKPCAVSPGDVRPKSHSPHGLSLPSLHVTEKETRFSVSDPKGQPCFTAHNMAICTQQMAGLGVLGTDGLSSPEGITNPDTYRAAQTSGQPERTNKETNTHTHTQNTRQVSLSFAFCFFFPSPLSLFLLPSLTPGWSRK